MTTVQRRLQGAAWVYEAVKAYGITDVDPDRCPIERTEKGKPYFSGRPDVFFSVSHSGDYWACAVAEQPLGLDLQKHKGGRLEDIARRFFHPQEADWLEANGIEYFYDVWASKESYVKWTGQGIDRHFDDFSVICEGSLAETGEGCYFYRCRWQEAYSLCLCGKGAWDQVEIIEIN